MCAADALQQNEFSDLYSEVGPDNVGGMGNEPSCTLTLLTRCQDTTQPCTHATAATSQHCEAGNGHTADQPQSSVNQTETAGASSAVTVASDSAPAAVIDNLPAASAQVESTSPVGDTAAPAQTSRVAASANQDPESRTTGQTRNDKLPSSGPHADLDSDAGYEAVMQISCRPHDVVASQAGHPHPMLLGLSDDVDCAVVSVSAAGQQLQAQHTASIPALAYVAAGLAGSCCCCVESHLVSTGV